MFGLKDRRLDCEGRRLASTDTMGILDWFRQGRVNPSPRPGLDAAKRVPVLEVARALGLAIGHDGRSFGPCPSCGAKVRASDGRSDRRGRCRVFKTGAGWACATNGSDGCGATGDGPGLVSWVDCGRPGPEGADVRVVLDWYRARGWLDANAGEGLYLGAGALAPMRGADHATTNGNGAQRADSGAFPALPRPPIDEVAALWERCGLVSEDAAVSAWLRGRTDGAIDPIAVDVLDLARALPEGLDLPRWAWRATRRGWGPWHVRGYRLIVRCFEADGAGGLRLASLHARSIIRGVPDGEKATWPTDYGAAGLVFAWSPPFGPELPLVEIAEGVPDWLRLACDRRGLSRRPKVWGVTSGGADASLAAAVPEGWTVALRTHADEAGDKYADQWGELLAARGCELRRARVTNGGNR